MRLAVLWLVCCRADDPGSPDPIVSVQRQRIACPSEMVRVPAGTFTMGDPDGPPDERPAHSVHLDPYCIDRREVTVRNYERCELVGKCIAKPADDRGLCNGAGRDNHPINCVAWEDARTYCDFVGKRLPTEAEWEFAARGDDGRRFPWGNDPPKAGMLNGCGTTCAAALDKLGRGAKPLFDADDTYVTTAPVGSLPNDASAFGVLDLAGNVSEWTADWYGPYAAGAATNPRGPTTGKAHTLRGGAWDSTEPEAVRAAARVGDGSTFPPRVGFRCAAAVAD